MLACVAGLVAGLVACARCGSAGRGVCACAYTYIYTYADADWDMHINLNRETDLKKNTDITTEIDGEAGVDTASAEPAEPAAPEPEQPAPASEQPASDTDSPTPEPEMSPAREWVLARDGDGTESPRDLQPATKYMLVRRTFGFIDLSGFTAVTRQQGPAIAAELLTAFRRETRLVASLRGVRVSKWMGDGAMLVSPDPGRIIATGAHIIHHFKDTRISVRVGLASGDALLFEGDDYIGEPVNLAFRLCEIAEAGEILADVSEELLPEWVKVVGKAEVDIRGVGKVDDILRLQPDLHQGS